MEVQVDTQSEEREIFTRSLDLFAPFSYVMACNKDVHQQLHQLEEFDPLGPRPDPDVWCAKVIESTALILAEMLDDLLHMVDETQRTGRAWSKLPASEKGEALRRVFDRSGVSAQFEDIGTVWWEPCAMIAHIATPPDGGCPARVALLKRPGMVARTRRDG